MTAPLCQSGAVAADKSPLHPGVGAVEVEWHRRCKQLKQRIDGAERPIYHLIQILFRHAPGGR